MLPSCVKNKKESIKFDHVKQLSLIDSFSFEHKKNVFKEEGREYKGSISAEIRLSEYQSFFADVFIPIYVNRWIIIQGQGESEPSIEAMAMGFRVTLDQEKLQLLYCEQMAYRGWRLIKEFVGRNQSLLLFETPWRICLIELIKVSDIEELELRIFLGNK